MHTQPYSKSMIVPITAIVKIRIFTPSATGGDAFAELVRSFERMGW